MDTGLMVPCFLSHIAIDEAQREQVVLLQGFEKPQWQLSIAIGLLEADGIAWQMRQQDFARPLTHDLSAAILQHGQGTVRGIEIHRCEEGIYFADLIVHFPDGEHRIDCRPSDGLAIIARQHDSFIHVAEHLLTDTTNQATDHGGDQPT